MKAGTLLLVFSDVVVMLKAKGLISPEGDFGDFSSLQNDLSLIKDIEAILEQHGVNVPDKLDKVLALIPLVVDLVR